ncbi:MAG: NAD(P)H-dependent oxidoreductase subunit E [Nitrospira sp.]|nr:NAD(P)H-dependent oxidoreductase subunit E [Nitrospira sp.]
MKIEELNVIEEIGRVGTIISRQAMNRGVLIHTLQKIQADKGYLPEDVLRNLSRKLDLPLAEIYSVASFYKQFHFTPRGKKVVRICMGTACYVRGAKNILSTLEESFSIKAGETTRDLAMTLETVGCIGCCGLAPVSTINEDVVGEIDSKKLNKVIKIIQEE